MTEALVFRALGDPLRLEIVSRLAAGISLTVGALSKDLGLTRQGARRHIQVLVDADVLSLEPDGREVLVHLEKKSLDTASAFLAQLEAQWDQRLLALKKAVEAEETGEHR